MCGLAQSFAQLAIARICVGLGQAGVTAPANALIGELFEARRRAAATSVYALGLPTGIIASFLVGSLLIRQADWRTALFAFAAPGLALAPILLRALPETRNRNPDRAAPASKPAMQVLRSLLSYPPFVHTALGSALFTAIWLALLSWLPTFFLRSHQLRPDQTGLPLALTLGLSQMLGLLFGGVISDRIARRDRRGYLWVCTAASLLATPFLAGGLLAGDPQIAMWLIFMGFAFGLLQGAPALATIQSIACPSYRAVSISGYLVIVNLIGGLGSQFIGLLSDWLSASLRQQSLGAALLIGSSVAGPWSALHFLLAARGLTRRDPDRAASTASA
jgi:predicted MFS family arabinose efflux permease